MGKEKKACDFSVDTDGICFICFHRISTFSDGRLNLTSINISPTPKHSLQCLSRFLKVDMKKVVIAEEDVPPSSNLLTQVMESKLKVELCAECESFNEKFSNLHLQLEKIKLEMLSLLRNIQPKLEKLREVDINYIKREFEQPSMDDMEKLLRIKKSEVVEVIREEVKQKCKLMLANTGPRVKLQTITQNDIHRLRRRCKINSTCSANKQTTSSDSSYGEPLIAKIEQEDSSWENPLDDDEDSFLMNIDSDSDGDDGIVSEVQSSLPNSQIDEQLDNQTNILQDPSYQLGKPKRQKTFHKGRARGSESGTTTRNILPKVDKSQSSIDPATGKHKCVRCSSEFTSRGHFLTHFRSHHLSAKYKCERCGKKFPQKGNYTRHYQQVHLGSKLQCPLCNKIFSGKNGLLIHHQTTHLGIRHKCEFCSQTFATRSSRHKHHRKLHGKKVVKKRRSRKK